MQFVVARGAQQRVGIRAVVDADAASSSSSSSSVFAYASEIDSEMYLMLDGRRRFLFRSLALVHPHENDRAAAAVAETNRPLGARYLGMCVFEFIAATPASALVREEVAATEEDLLYFLADPRTTESDLLPQPRLFCLAPVYCLAAETAADGGGEWVAEFWTSVTTTSSGAAAATLSLNLGAALQAAYDPEEGLSPVRTFDLKVRYGGNKYTVRHSAVFLTRGLRVDPAAGFSSSFVFGPLSTQSTLGIAQRGDALAEEGEDPLWALLTSASGSGSGSGSKTRGRPQALTFVGVDAVESAAVGAVVGAAGPGPAAGPSEESMTFRGTELHETDKSMLPGGLQESATDEGGGGKQGEDRRAADRRVSERVRVYIASLLGVVVLMMLALYVIVGFPGVLRELLQKKGSLRWQLNTYLSLAFLVIGTIFLMVYGTAEALHFRGSLALLLVTVIFLETGMLLPLFTKMHAISAIEAGLNEPDPTGQGLQSSVHRLFQSLVASSMPGFVAKPDDPACVAVAASAAAAAAGPTSAASVSSSSSSSGPGAASSAVARIPTHASYPHIATGLVLGPFRGNEKAFRAALFADNTEPIELPMFAYILRERMRSALLCPRHPMARQGLPKALPFFIQRRSHVRSYRQFLENGTPIHSVCRVVLTYAAKRAGNTNARLATAHTKENQSDAHYHADSLQAWYYGARRESDRAVVATAPPRPLALFEMNAAATSDRLRRAVKALLNFVDKEASRRGEEEEEEEDENASGGSSDEEEEEDGDDDDDEEASDDDEFDNDPPRKGRLATVYLRTRPATMGHFRDNVAFEDLLPWGMAEYVDRLLNVATESMQDVDGRVGPLVKAFLERAARAAQKTNTELEQLRRLQASWTPFGGLLQFGDKYGLGGHSPATSAAAAAAAGPRHWWEKEKPKTPMLFSGGGGGGGAGARANRVIRMLESFFLLRGAPEDFASWQHIVRGNDDGDNDGDNDTEKKNKKEPEGKEVWRALLIDAFAKLAFYDQEEENPINVQLAFWALVCLNFLFPLSQLESLLATGGDRLVEVMQTVVAGMRYPALMLWLSVPVTTNVRAELGRLSLAGSATDPDAALRSVCGARPTLCPEDVYHDPKGPHAPSFPFLRHVAATWGSADRAPPIEPDVLLTCAYDSTQLALFRNKREARWLEEEETRHRPLPWTFYRAEEEFRPATTAEDPTNPAKRTKSLRLYLMALRSLTEGAGEDSDAFSLGGAGGEDFRRERTEREMRLAVMLHAYKCFSVCLETVLFTAKSDPVTFGAAEQLYWFYRPLQRLARETLCEAIAPFAQTAVLAPALVVVSASGPGSVDVDIEKDYRALPQLDLQTVFRVYQEGETPDEDEQAAVQYLSDNVVSKVDGNLAPAFPAPNQSRYVGVENESTTHFKKLVLLTEPAVFERNNSSPPKPTKELDTKGAFVFSLDRRDHIDPASKTPYANEELGFFRFLSAKWDSIETVANNTVFEQKHIQNPMAYLRSKLFSYCFSVQERADGVVVYDRYTISEEKEKRLWKLVHLATHPRVQQNYPLFTRVVLRRAFAQDWFVKSMCASNNYAKSGRKLLVDMLRARNPYTEQRSYLTAMGLTDVRRQRDVLRFLLPRTRITETTLPPDLSLFRLVSPAGAGAGATEFPNVFLELQDTDAFLRVCSLASASATGVYAGKLYARKSVPGKSLADSPVVAELNLFTVTYLERCELLRLVVSAGCFLARAKWSYSKRTPLDPLQFLGGGDGPGGVLEFSRVLVSLVAASYALDVPFFRSSAKATPLLARLMEQMLETASWVAAGAYVTVSAETGYTAAAGSAARRKDKDKDHVLAEAIARLCMDMARETGVTESAGRCLYFLFLSASRWGGAGRGARTAMYLQSLIEVSLGFRFVYGQAPPPSPPPPLPASSPTVLSGGVGETAADAAADAAAAGWRDWISSNVSAVLPTNLSPMFFVFVIGALGIGIGAYYKWGKKKIAPPPVDSTPPPVDSTPPPVDSTPPPVEPSEDESTVDDSKIAPPKRVLLEHLENNKAQLTEIAQNLNAAWTTYQESVKAAFANDKPDLVPVVEDATVLEESFLSSRIAEFVYASAFRDFLIDPGLSCSAAFSRDKRQYEGTSDADDYNDVSSHIRLLHVYIPVVYSAQGINEKEKMEAFLALIRLDDYLKTKSDDADEAYDSATAAVDDYFRILMLDCRTGHELVRDYAVFTLLNRAYFALEFHKETMAADKRIFHPSVSTSRFLSSSAKNEGLFQAAIANIANKSTDHDAALAAALRPKALAMKNWAQKLGECVAGSPVVLGRKEIAAGAWGALIRPVWMYHVHRARSETDVVLGRDVLLQVSSGDARLVVENRLTTQAFSDVFGSLRSQWLRAGFADDVRRKYDEKSWFFVPEEEEGNGNNTAEIPMRAVGVHLLATNPMIMPLHEMYAFAPVDQDPRALHGSKQSAFSIEIALPRLLRLECKRNSVKRESTAEGNTNVRMDNYIDDKTFDFWYDKINTHRVRDYLTTTIVKLQSERKKDKVDDYVSKINASLGVDKSKGDDGPLAAFIGENKAETDEFFGAINFLNSFIEERVSNMANFISLNLSEQNSETMRERNLEFYFPEVAQIGKMEFFTKDNVPIVNLYNASRTDQVFTIPYMTFVIRCLTVIEDNVAESLGTLGLTLWSLLKLQLYFLATFLDKSIDPKDRKGGGFHATLLGQLWKVTDFVMAAENIVDEYENDARKEIVVMKTEYGNRIDKMWNELDFLTTIPSTLPLPYNKLYTGLKETIFVVVASVEYMPTETKVNKENVKYQNKQIQRLLSQKSKNENLEFIDMLPNSLHVGNPNEGVAENLFGAFYEKWKQTSAQSIFSCPKVVTPEPESESESESESD